MQALYTAEGVNLSGKSVLLIDDVRTSGATGSACARAVVEAGASRTVLYVAGRDTGTPSIKGAT